MPPAQNVALKPSFDGMLADFLNYAAFWRNLPAVCALGEVRSEPDLLGDLVNCFEPVGLRFNRPEDAEAVHVPPHHFPQEIAERRDVPGQSCAGFFDLDRRAPKVGHLQRLSDKT